jgi:hypothetical protein
LITAVSGCSSKILLHPDQKPNRVVVSDFHILLKHFNTNEFNSGNYASLIIALSRPAFPSADLIQIHRSFNSEQNKHIKQQLDSVYTAVQNNFKAIGIDLLPSGYLATKNDIPVGPYGFPHSSDLKTNAKVADAGLNLTFYLETDNIDVNHVAPNISQIRYRPKLTIELTMMSNDGKVIWKDNAISLSHHSVEIEERTTGGITTLDVRYEPSLSDMVNRALQKMITRLPSSLRKAA